MHWYAFLTHQIGLFLFYLHSLPHASANNQHVYALLKYLLQISRLHTWDMLMVGKQSEITSHSRGILRCSARYKTALKIHNGT